jgi:hypothetical protein
MPKEKAIEFIRETVPSEEKAIGEWTDRSNCVRSRYTNGKVFVYTHGMSAAYDYLPLLVAILEYLADYDLLEN